MAGCSYLCSFNFTVNFLFQYLLIIFMVPGELFFMSYCLLLGFTFSGKMSKIQRDLLMESIEIVISCHLEIKIGSMGQRV